MLSSLRYDMRDSILYQVDHLTLTETGLIHRHTSVPYSSIVSTSIQRRRPLAWLGLAGVMGFLASCTAQWWGAGLMGSRLSLKIGLLMAIPAAAIAVYGLTYQVSCLQLRLDERSLTVLKRKDPYPVEVAQRVIETAKRVYGAIGRSASVGAADLRSDLNPL